ncbi:hypothetical protein LX36DRAFT_163683 [Colletotrichum falcatum]|nr:hypothetical protein LX36DRAFT_163683 [Colletotrichum falcatum]
MVDVVQRSSDLSEGVDCGCRFGRRMSLLILVGKRSMPLTSGSICCRIEYRMSLPTLEPWNGNSQRVQRDRHVSEPKYGYRSEKIRAEQEPRDLGQASGFSSLCHQQAAIDWRLRFHWARLKDYDYDLGSEASCWRLPAVIFYHSIQPNRSFSGFKDAASLSIRCAPRGRNNMCRTGPTRTHEPLALMCRSQPIDQMKRAVRLSVRFYAFADEECRPSRRDGNLA